MTQWEYRVVQFQPKGFFGSVIDHQEMADFLNERGAEGWELVSTLDTNAYKGGTRDVLIFLKRPCTAKYPMDH